MNQTKQTEEHEDGLMHLQKEGKSGKLRVIGFGIPNHLREVRKQQLYCSRPTIFHITFICCSSSKAYYVVDSYCFRLLIKSGFLFKFYRQKRSRTEWIALQKNQSSCDFGPASKQTDIFFGGWFYLGTTSVMHRKTKVTSTPKSIHDTFGNILLWIFLKEDLGSHFVEKTIFNQLIQHSSDLL